MEPGPNTTPAKYPAVANKNQIRLKVRQELKRRSMRLNEAVSGAYLGSLWVWVYGRGSIGFCELCRLPEPFVGVGGRSARKLGWLGKCY